MFRWHGELHYGAMLVSKKKTNHHIKANYTDTYSLWMLKDAPKSIPYDAIYLAGMPCVLQFTLMHFEKMTYKKKHHTEGYRRLEVDAITFLKKAIKLQAGGSADV